MLMRVPGLLRRLSQTSVRSVRFMPKLNRRNQATHPGQEIAAIPLSGRTDDFTLLLDANTGE